MLCAMANTCYVRYPDAEKDDPEKPGEPNSVVEISAHKLDGYRSRGFVQCAADGGKLDEVQALGSGGEDAEAPELAGVDADPVAAKLQAGDEADPPPAAGTKSKAGSTAPSGSSSTGGNS